jgi:hypothetical protein
LVHGIKGLRPCYDSYVTCVGSSWIQ